MNTFFAISTLILSGTQVLVGFLAVGTALGSGIFIVKSYIRKQSERLKKQTFNYKSSTIRKDKVVDLNQYQSSIKLVAMVTALTIVVITFAWTQFTHKDVLQSLGFESLELELEIPLTTQAPKLPSLPPPPKMESLVFDPTDEPIIEPDPEPIVEPTPDPSPTPSSYTGATDPNAKVMPPVASIPPPLPMVEDIPKDIIILVPERMPLFPGCEEISYDDYEAKKKCADQSLLSYIYSCIKYPAMARESGIEGTVVVTFVVRKDGSVDGIKLLRDIGGGCGKEVIRIIKKMNKMPKKWTPGKQRGRKVSVRFNMPVKFALD